jgi:hypothetical protein
MTESEDDAAIELGDLTMAGQVLFALAKDIPTPDPDNVPEVSYLALLGIRAVSLYENYLHSRSSPAPLGRLIAIRPLVELAILTKWISLDPTFHGELWMADSEAAELTQIKHVTDHLKNRGNHPQQPDTEGIARKEALRDEAKAKLKAASRNYGNRLIPTVIRMVEEVEKEVPGHKIAMRDAYELAYRTFSPWEHTDASSYKASAERSDIDDFTFLGDRSPFHSEDIDAIATSMFAYVLESVLTGAQIGDPKMARFVRDFVTQHWVRSDRVQPPDDRGKGHGT